MLAAGQFVAVFGPADAYLASLDSVLGNDESAERLFGRALVQNRALGSVVHRAAILAAWAGHLRSRGGPPRRYEELRDEARRLAATTGQARVVRTLDSQDNPAGHAAGLTARELDVLRLLARGHSNRAIATELRISENTAANHVRSILIKTGATNRTQVAMMAVSRQWVDDRASSTATAPSILRFALPDQRGLATGLFRPIIEVPWLPEEVSPLLRQASNRVCSGRRAIGRSRLALVPACCPPGGQHGPLSSGVTSAFTTDPFCAVRTQNAWRWYVGSGSHGCTG